MLFAYDGVPEAVALPLDGSKRNRPATTAILVDGAVSTWTLGDDRYTLKSATLLPPVRIPSRSERRWPT
jgi:hypothetical protein